MQGTSNVLIGTIVMLLIFLAGCIWLQIFLSKRENKWLGLIIPLICLVFAIMTVFSLSLYTNTGIISVLATVIPVFLISNIPTLLFLAIYLACREKFKLRTELDKMNIQDL